MPDEDGRGECLAEVNGVPVLVRRPDGSLEAPEGLEGIAALFEAEGTAEKVYPRLLDRLEGVGEPVQRIIQLAYEAQRADGEARSGDCGAALEELARIFRENPDLHP